jgi:hypothetical protein
MIQDSTLIAGHKRKVSTNVLPKILFLSIEVSNVIQYNEYYGIRCNVQDDKLLYVSTRLYHLSYC